MAATGFFSAMIAGILVAAAGLAFLRPLGRLLGSTETILPYAVDYMRWILVGTPFMMSSLVLNNQLRFQGSAFYGMIGIASSAIVNIALDPLLIFGLKLGVAGAGWATIISQFVSFCLLLRACTQGSNIRIRFRNFKLKLFYYKMIVQGGLPSLARQILSSLAAICLNHAAQPYGDAAIAAMGVVQRVMMFGASAMLGFGQGFQPVCGFNFGAGLYKRVKEGFWFCVKFSVVALVAIAALGYSFAPQLIALFQDDPAVISFGIAALRFQCLTFPLQSWIIMANMMQQSMGRTVPATFLSVARQGLFFIPMVLVLPAILDATGIQAAQSAADLLTFLCSVPIHIRVLKSIGE
jgi:putative MATE family efflux protein